MIKNVNPNDPEYNTKIPGIVLYKFKFCINLNCAGSVPTIGIIKVNNATLYNKFLPTNLYLAMTYAGIADNIVLMTVAASVITTLNKNICAMLNEPTAVFIL